MRLEKYSREKLKKELLAIIGENLDLGKYKVFFFGSRVLGKGTDRSDIDVGIEGPEPIPFDVLGSIKDMVNDIPTIYTIDVVDFKRVSRVFKQIAKEKVEYIN